MTLTERGSGKVLGRATAAEESSLIQGTLAPTTNRQLSAIAQQLAELLKR